MGTPAKPTALRLAKPGERPPPPEPGRVLGLPEEPDDLPPLARAEWYRIAPTLARLGLLAVDEDQQPLRAYCCAVAMHAKATAELEAEGLTVRTAAGGLKPHPSVATALSASRDIRAWAQHFGLTPSARVGVVVDPESVREVKSTTEDEDYLDQKMRG